jgi:uncharacterized OsmC-like protein
MASREEIRAALEHATQTVTLKQSVGRRFCTAVVEEGLACCVQEKNHVVMADLPPSMGGEDSAPSPSVLLRAALASCVAMGVKLWAARKDVAVDRVEVRVETEYDARGQFGVSETIVPGFQSVRIHIDVQSAADPDLIRGIVDTSLRFSPLTDAFRRAQVLETHLSVGQPVQ